MVVIIWLAAAVEPVGQAAQVPAARAEVDLEQQQPDLDQEQQTPEVEVVLPGTMLEEHLVVQVVAG